MKADDRSRGGNLQAPRIAMQMPTQVMPGGMMGIQQHAYPNGYVGSQNLSMMGANMNMNGKGGNTMRSAGHNEGMNEGVKSDNVHTRTAFSHEQNTHSTEQTQTGVNTTLEKPRMNFARIYEFFSRLFDPTQSASDLEKLVEQTFNVLDSEIIKLLASNLEMNLRDNEFRNMLLETYQ
ncbi:hypothetical protein NDN08_003302 [Rhodosorus marinus]|uniref:Uncharacterized protein n=1 Tax=Rhodosorus marinus TaxID=101924 RepID=A0AAV8UW47_9RHOD|nr:hypothetical protein NDN08_003302 [Rhodosorus marinus]